MKLYNEFVIPENDPFHNDKFDRRGFIDNLMIVLSTYNSGTVISIDSSWGTGKTTFIKMWETYIKNHANFEAIYFNAWDNDDNIDPLIPLISLISERLVKEKNGSIKESKLFKIGTEIIKKGIPIGLNLLTGGVLNSAGFKFDDISEEKLRDLSGMMSESIFENQKQKEELKKQLKEALIEYQNSINKKVIIFIDELDRCRPLYAIEVLERIKHFFDLENFIFILAMDKTQLSHSVCTVYGSNMDSVGYLRRFIDLEFMLPLPDLGAYFDYLIKDIAPFYVNFDYFSNLLKNLVMINKLSLRDIDKLFVNLKVLLPLIDYFNDKTSRYNVEYGIFISNIYAFLMLMKITQPDKYKNIVEKKYINSETHKFIQLSSNKEVKLYHNRIDSNLLSVFFDKSVSKFLSFYLTCFKENENYAITRENRDSFRVTTGDEYETLGLDIVYLWDKNKPCPIIKNILFTNSINYKV